MEAPETEGSQMASIKDFAAGVSRFIVDLASVSVRTTAKEVIDFHHLCTDRRA
jgi:hypothetical protein